MKLCQCIMTLKSDISMIISFNFMNLNEIFINMNEEAEQFNG